jgi:hypothetical protein
VLNCLSLKSGEGAYHLNLRGYDAGIELAISFGVAPYGDGSKTWRYAQAKRFAWKRQARNQ